jgi:CelD/BcsL family acetyltransferase involved in cellulose biosynthesis
LAREIEVLDTIAVYRDSAEWGPIEPAWKALRQQQPAPNLEHHPAWLDVEVCGENERHVMVAALLHGPELLGVAPFLSRRWCWCSQLAWRTVARFNLRLVDLMGEGPLAAADPRAQEALLLAIGRAAEPYDAIFLEGLPVGSALWNVIQSSPEVRRLYRLWMPSGVTQRHRIRLPASYEDYLHSQFPRKRRNALRRLTKKLESRAPVAIERVTRVEELPRFFGMVEKVAARTWQALRLGQVFTADCPLAARLVRCAERGWLRSYVLLCGGEPIAFGLGLQADQVYRYEVIGYDPDWSEYGPGNVLLLRLLEDLFAFEKPQLLDFGHGESELKHRFANDLYPEANVYLVRRTPAATIAYVSAIACGGANRASKRLLGFAHMARAIRHRLRNGETRPHHHDDEAESPA